MNIRGLFKGRSNDLTQGGITGPMLMFALPLAAGSLEFLHLSWIHGIFAAENRIARAGRKCFRKTIS